MVTGRTRKFNNDEQLEDPKIANAESKFQQFEINTYDDVENQPSEEQNQQIFRSKVHYYWSKKQQDQFLETKGTNSFYCNNAQTSIPTPQYHSSLLISQLIINPQLSYEEQKIADQLVGKYITNYNQQQEVVNQKSLTRRNNIQRPVLDFKQNKTYEPEIIPQKEEIIVETGSQKQFKV